MRADVVVVALAAVGFVAGLLLVVTGLWPSAAAQARRNARVPVRTFDGRRLVPLAVGVVMIAVVFALSGWLLAAAAVGALVGWAVFTWQQRERSVDTGVERVEAVASWVENVRDVLRAGNQPVGAIGATVDTAPLVIRSQVRLLYARLSAGQSADVALRRFADEMNDPLADLVAVGLLIAVSRGAETEQVLSSLADQARHQADRRRIVEAERAPMRREVQMVTAVMCALLGCVFVFSRSSYLNAYDEPSGQVFLTVILGAYAGMIVWVGRLARFARPARFLTMGGER
jgi:tight adherence protein B